MRRILSFPLGIAVGAMLCYGATNFYVVRADDGIHLVHKQRARLSEAYVDVREFDAGDWSRHAELAAALVAENKQQLMGSAVANSLQNGLSQLPAWSTKQVEPPRK
jgi:hypothetical protein